MSYVEQICDGYSKKTLMGNWNEERSYPTQPFRDAPVKKVKYIDYAGKRKRLRNHMF